MSKQLNLLDKELLELSKNYDSKIQELNKCATPKDIANNWRINVFTKSKPYTSFVSIESAVEYISKRLYKKYTEKREKTIARFEKIKNSPDFIELKLSIDWVKSSTWGSNPHGLLEVWTSNGYESYNYKASGCGYCKESATMAGLFNQCNSLLKLWLDAKEKGLQSYGLSDYGFSSGGVGVNSLQTAFAVLGFKLEKVASGKMYDCYKTVKIENQNK